MFEQRALYLIGACIANRAAGSLRPDTMRCCSAISAQVAAWLLTSAAILTIIADHRKRGSYLPSLRLP